MNKVGTTKVSTTNYLKLPAINKYVKVSNKLILVQKRTRIPTKARIATYTSKRIFPYYHKCQTEN